MVTDGSVNEAETAPKVGTPETQSVAKAFSGASLSAEAVDAVVLELVTRSGYTALSNLPKSRLDILRADVRHIAEILTRNKARVA